MYSLWAVYMSFVTSFITQQVFYILVASAALYGVVKLLKSLMGGGSIG